MIHRKSGKIINVSSVWGAVGASMEVAYSAAKGGVNAFTRALAKEVAPSHIQVNAIAPGYFMTEMTRPFFEDEDHSKWIKERIPLGYVGTEADLAGTVIFLASHASDYVTGQTILVDGGWMAG